MTPEELLSVADFTHIRDALSPEQALEILPAGQRGKGDDCPAQSRRFPAYTTSPGWPGYSDEKLVRLSKEAAAEGFSMMKLSTGRCPRPSAGLMTFWSTPPAGTSPSLAAPN